MTSAYSHICAYAGTRRRRVFFMRICALTSPGLPHLCAYVHVALGEGGGIKHTLNKLFVSGVILISPSFPTGFPPRVRTSIVLLKCGTNFPPFEKKFGFRTDIIERRTVLAENPARAEEFGTRAPRPCLLNVSSALGTQIARRDLQAAARRGATARQTSQPPQCGTWRRIRADCDAGERRVIPSSKNGHIVFKDASNECALVGGSTSNKITSCQATLAQAVRK